MGGEHCHFCIANKVYNSNVFLTISVLYIQLAFDYGCPKRFERLLLQNSHNLDQNEGGTNGFRVYGSNDMTHNTLIVQGNLSDPIDQVRIDG